MLDPKGIDFVIPLGRGSQFENCELRYCLRSLEKHAKGVRRVVVIGDEEPEFLSKRGVVFLRSPELPFPKEARIALKVQWAFENFDLSDEILFGNDDFFFLKPFDARTVPYFQKGTLMSWATADRRPKGSIEPWAPGLDQDLLRMMHEALVAAELPAFSYELHYPIRYRRDVYCRDLKRWWEESSKTIYGLGPKSIYGNYLFRDAPGPFLQDLKIARYHGEADVAKRLAETPDRICLSYADQALFDDFGTWLYARCPDKSRFEA